VWLGIYELDGATLKVCFDTAGQQRPTEFKSEPGSGVLVAVCNRGASPSDGQTDIVGEYVAESMGTDGSRLITDVTIERRGDAYDVTWFKNGKVGSVATGIRKGDVFSACFALQGAVGVVVYEIQKDGSLIGQYTALRGIGLLCDETLTRKKKTEVLKSGMLSVSGGMISRVRHTTTSVR
jgi:hypothetical protein